MTITPDQYEKLGTFYLGRGYDTDAKKLQDDLVLYDSKDLVTHGVVLGMTGSGKTGLCLALLEEAAMDGIPVIAIDPKGDIGNVMFTFPKLDGPTLKPWVNEDDARRKGVSVDDYAQGQADLWKKGLGEWGQSEDRIKSLREKVDMTIYTPGSNAGIPVSILSSLGAPSDEVMEDREMLADRIESTVSSILALCGIEADPVQSREHILMSNIVSHCWAKKQNLSLENLVRLIQQPPVRKIGVESVDNFFPEEKRNELAMKINNLIASPGFAVWMEGEPLDIQRMFYTADGKPRISIFSISHLSDTERMFFVSLLMNQLLGWMRQQSGTTSLRALFYMDEIFGYLPPTANPPSKKPMMILLKQARAFGLGLLLATQNPVDLDYKALSNIGTWWIGRLQTERDKMRLLDGLEGAVSGQGANFDRSDIEKLMSGLGNRIFLMNNVHEDGPVTFNVRWCMTYLRGPVSRTEIKKLMDPVRDRFVTKKAKAAAEDDGFAPPGASGDDSEGVGLGRPHLPDGISEAFFPVSPELHGVKVHYRPALLQEATVMLDYDRLRQPETTKVTRVNVIDTDSGKVLWDKTIEFKPELDIAKCESSPETEEATFEQLPSSAMKAKTFSQIEKAFVDEVYAHYTFDFWKCPLLKTASGHHESEGDFRARLALVAREQRDVAVDDLRAKYAKKVKALEDSITKALAKVDAQKAQASSAKLSTAIQIGSTILGALLGRKTGGILGAATLVKGSTVSSASRAWKEGQDVDAAAAEVAKLKLDYEELGRQIEAEVKTIQESYEPNLIKLELSRITPLKKNITLPRAGILWMPYERAGGSLRPAWS